MKTTRNTRNLLLLTVVILDLLLLAGCTANWISQANSIITVLGGAALNILALIAALSGKTVSIDDVNLINKVMGEVQAGLTKIQQLIEQYQATPAASVLDEINAVISVVQQNLGGLLPMLHITDAATVQKITAVVGIVIAEVQSLEALIPIIKTGDLKALRQAVKTSHLLTSDEFASAFDDIMHVTTGSVVVDAAIADVPMLSN